MILALLVVAFGLGAALSYYVGFRPGRTHRPFEAAIVGFGISIVLAFLLLLLLDRIQLDMPVENLLGVVALTSVPIGIGFAIGNALAPKEGGEGSERSAAGRAICSPRRPEPSSSRSTSRRPRSRSVSGKSSTGSA